jgi:hypothetical protein
MTDLSILYFFKAAVVRGFFGVWGGRICCRIMRLLLLAVAVRHSLKERGLILVRFVDKKKVAPVRATFSDYAAFS